MTFTQIDKENWILFAAQHYDSTGQTMEDFYNDLKKFKYINKLLFRYKNGEPINVKLLINHLVVVTNLFGVEVGSTLLFFRIKPEYWSDLKTMLFFLGMVVDEDLPSVPLSEKTLALIKQETNL